MPIHGRIAGIAGPFLRTQARNLYQVVKYQDKLIDRTYRKAGLYNRGLVKGIQHGLAGGQIVGGTLKLGLAPDSPGNELQTPIQRKQPKTGKSYKTRNRYSKRANRCVRPYRSPGRR